MAYLHGSETLEIQVAGRRISIVLSSVVGFVGLAPKGPVNTLKLITSPANAVSTFGAEVPGFTLPEALAAHFAEGGGAVLCVNVFDAATNTAPVASETAVVTAGRVTLASAPVSGFVLKTADLATTLTLGTDYTVNAYGVVSILNRSSSGGYPDGTSLKASYTKLDAATVTSAQIIGANDGVSRTGSYQFELARSTYGFDAKILAAPHFSQLASVAQRLEAMSAKYRAVALIDGPVGATMSAVLAGRGVVNPLGGFGSRSKRSYLCYPYQERPDPAVVPDPVTNPDPQKMVPYSAIMAGVISATDNDPNKGFWHSPSNQVLQGVTGLEIPLSAAINDSTTDVQLLNAAGITTTFGGYGTGFRTWGNRSAAFPTETGIETFLCVRRTADIIEETIELAWLPYADKPTNLANIDAVRQYVNGVLADLRKRGAILGGKCEFLEEDNDPAALENGNPVFSYDFLPPPPMERGTFRAKLNTAYLKTLFA